MTNMQKHYVKTLPPKRVGEFVELAEGYRATANTERLVLCIHAINRRRFWRIASFRSDAGFGRYRRIAINLNCTSTRPGSAAHRHPQSFHWHTSAGRTAQIESCVWTDLALVRPMRRPGSGRAISSPSSAPGRCAFTLTPSELCAAGRPADQAPERD